LQKCPIFVWSGKGRKSSVKGRKISKKNWMKGGSTKDVGEDKADYTTF
jgi:hypothetical protein